MNIRDGAYFRDKYIKKIINLELEKRKNKITQSKLAEDLGYTQGGFQPYIKGTRIPKDDSLYIKIFEYFGFSEEKISEIFKNAKLEEIKTDFGEEIGMKSLIIEDNGQEPITTIEEAEKVLFKMNGIKPTEEALRSVRLAIDMIKFDQNKNK